MTSPVVDVSGLVKRFHTATPWGSLRHRESVALNGVDFRLDEGDFAALVGESGSGKTTLGRCLLGTLPFDEGRVRVAGFEVNHLGRRNRRAFCRAVQMVFQNPYASLNPAFRVRVTLAEALRIHRDLPRGALDREVERMARSVRLPLERLDEFPHRLSGGERRRVAFARALATRPRFVVADEPVSGLDPPIQVQLLDLLKRIQDRGGITILYISHDLRVLRALATRVLVLYRGRIVEDAPGTRFFEGGACHPYSKELLLSAFSAETYLSAADSAPRRPPEPGGCPFRHRCPLAGIAADSPCATMAPPSVQLERNHTVRCHRWRDL